MPAFTVVDGRITDIAAMVDPAKLAGAVVDDAAHLAHRALDRAGVLDDGVDGDADGVLDQGGEVGGGGLGGGGVGVGAALELTEAATRLQDGAAGVTDEIWDTAADHFSQEQLSAIILEIAMTNFFNRINRTIREQAGKTW